MMTWKWKDGGQGSESAEFSRTACLKGSSGQLVCCEHTCFVWVGGSVGPERWMQWWDWGGTIHEELGKICWEVSASFQGYWKVTEMLRAGQWHDQTCGLHYLPHYRVENGLKCGKCSFYQDSFQGTIFLNSTPECLSSLHCQLYCFLLICIRACPKV